MSHKNVDIAIVGSGFAGSLMAMVARSLGHSVVMIEKQKHPRFVIGESSTPLANLLLEELASRYHLPSIAPLSKWKTWQEAHPSIGCGLKCGFTFYHHTFDEPFFPDPERRNQLLVAASPHEGLADTHWFRPEFDQFLVGEAQDLGVEYLDEVYLEPPHFRDGAVTLSGRRQKDHLFIEAHFLIDATGTRGYLHRTLNLPERRLENLSPTQGLFAHFTNVARLESVLPRSCVDEAPYQVDDAAVHHVFDGGWIWVLRFNNGVTSAGVTAIEEVADKLRFSEGSAAWGRLLERLPTVARQFEDARPLTPFVHARRLSFHSDQIADLHWAMLPSAAAFTDPLLSTGFPLTLLGILRLGEIIERHWNRPSFFDQLETYANQTRNEFLAAERLIGALFHNMDDFELFAAISLLYFAAASYTESARRLGKPDLAGGFLMFDHPLFGPASRSCIDRAMQPLESHDRERLIKQIHETISPIDVAGLGGSERRNWHPVLAQDLIHARNKLEATPSEIQNLLRRTGF